MNCQVDIKVSKWSIHIKGPYNERMQAKYRARGGEFRKEEGVWLIPRIDSSYKLLKEEFNWVPGCDVTQITVHIDDDDVLDVVGVLYYKGYILATRRWRDSQVRTYDGVVANGEYSWSGGSVKNPRVLPGSTVSSWDIMTYDGIPRKAVYNPLARFSTEKLLEELERRNLCVHSPAEQETQQK